MTPLAQRIVNQHFVPVKDRAIVDQCGLLNRMSDIHCFDVTSVFELAGGLSEKLLASVMDRGSFAHDEKVGFLPAAPDEAVAAIAKATGSQS